METVQFSKDLPRLFKFGKGIVEVLDGIIDEVCGVGPGVPVGKLLNIRSEDLKEKEQLLEVNKSIMAFKILVWLLFKSEEYENPEQMIQSVKKLANLPEKYVKSVKLLAGVIFRRKDEIRKALIEQTITLSDRYLKDFDWKLTLVVSSDKCSNIREHVVLLALYLIDENKRKKQVLIELNEKDLDGLIKNCDEIQKVIQKLK